jgi:hypothetical protein
VHDQLDAGGVELLDQLVGDRDGGPGKPYRELVDAVHDRERRTRVLGRAGALERGSRGARRGAAPAVGRPRPGEGARLGPGRGDLGVERLRRPRDHPVAGAGEDRAQPVGGADVAVPADMYHADRRHEAGR